MHKLVGDLAEDVASSLLEQQPDGPFEAAQEQVLHEQKRGIFTKMEFHWRTSDRRNLDAIRAAGDAMFADEFADALETVDEFYRSVRVQATNEHGIPLFNQEKRPVWKKEQGRFVEDWNQLTGQDIDAALFHLQRVMFTISEQHSSLLSEAVLAKHIYDDIREDAWEDIFDGTTGDKQAKAGQLSRNDKYHYFLRWYLYSRSQSFVQELRNFMRLLERLRYWRLNESGTQTP